VKKCQLRVTPSKIDLAQVDAPLVLAFLTDIEKGRGNTARTRNARLAAIRLTSMNEGADP
jgi:integrase/recombinase XerD